MKRKLIFLIISVLFIIPLKVNAEEYHFCETKNLNKIQVLSSNITTSYTYEEKINENNIGEVYFQVKLSNLNDLYYLKRADTEEILNFSNNELIINNVLPGTLLSIDVYSNGLACKDDYLRRIYVNIPSYNPYYMDKVCENYQNYKLCNKWANVNMTYEQFLNTVRSYSNKTETTDKNSDTKSFNEIFIEIVYFLDQYRFIIIVPVLLVTIVGIITIKIKDKKEEFDFKLK